MARTGEYNMLSGDMSAWVSGAKASAEPAATLWETFSSLLKALMQERPSTAPCPHPLQSEPHDFGRPEKQVAARS